MRVEVRKNRGKINGLIVVPETTFEEDFIEALDDGEKLNVWRKHGMSLDHLVGLVVEPKEEGNEVSSNSTG